MIGQFKNLSNRQKTPGIHWGGRADYEAGLVHSEAFYGQHRVKEIVDLVDRTGLDRAMEVINSDVDSDGFGAIARDEIVEVLEWAASNETETLRPIKKIQKSG